MYLPLAAIDGGPADPGAPQPTVCGTRTAAVKAGATFEVARPATVRDRNDWDSAADKELQAIVATAPTAVVVDTSFSRAELSPAALLAARDAEVRIVIIGAADKKGVAGVIFQDITTPAGPVVDRIARTHPKGGKVLVVLGESSMDQHGLRDAFHARPGLSAVTRTVGLQTSPSELQRHIERDLKDNSGIVAVIAESASHAAAARAAVAANGSADRVDLWALGGYQDIPDAVAAGTMSGFVTTTPATVGAKAVGVALGSPTGVEVDVPALLITEKSLSQFRQAATC